MNASNIVDFLVAAGVAAAAVWYVAAASLVSHRGDRYKVAAFNYWGPIVGAVTMSVLTGSNMLALYLAPEQVTTNLLDVILYGFVFPLALLNIGYRYPNARAAWRQERAIRRGDLVRITDTDGTVLILTPAAVEKRAARRRESARLAWEADRRRRDLHNKLTVPIIPKD